MLSPPRGILFNSFPRRLRRIIEFHLHLLHAIASRNEHARNDEWIRFLSGSFKFGPGLLFEQ